MPSAQRSGLSDYMAIVHAEGVRRKKTARINALN
jgi:hypothetical protein